MTLAIFIAGLCAIGAGTLPAALIVAFGFNLD
jgi:hypothetical protein